MFNRVLKKFAKKLRVFDNQDFVQVITAVLRLIGAVVGSRNHFKGIMSIHIRFATLTFVKSCFG